MKEFLIFLLTSGGLATATTFVVQPLKKWLGWDGNKALALTGVVAAVIVGAAYAVLKYNLWQPLEEFWPLIVLWWGLIFGTGTGIYKFGPKTENKQ